MCTRLYLHGHPDILASSVLEHSQPDVLLASENGEYVETSRVLLASSSKMLAGILTSQPYADCIILPGVPFRHVELLVEMLQCGEVVSSGCDEAEHVMSLAHHLLLPGSFSLVKEERTENHHNLEDVEDEDMEDDVFATGETDDYAMNNNDNNDALDLSPASRLNTKCAAPKHFSFEFPANVSSETHASKNPGNSETPSSISSQVSSPATTSLQRRRKPPPLKYLQSLDCQPPPVQTPWTPLAASPVIEETFKKIVQQAVCGGGSRDTESEEKLRNLSVSSADFENSLPSTPVKKESSLSNPAGTLSIGSKSISKKSKEEESLDLSTKVIKSEPKERDTRYSLLSQAPQSPKPVSSCESAVGAEGSSASASSSVSIKPAANIFSSQARLSVDSGERNCMKTEISDEGNLDCSPEHSLGSDWICQQQTSSHQSPPLTHHQQTSSHQSSHLSLPHQACSPSPQQPAPVALPELLIPAIAKTLTPIQQMLFFRQQKAHELLAGNRTSSLLKSASLANNIGQAGKKKERERRSSGHSDAKIKTKQFKSKPSEGGEGRFKCERCGKTYNWNYNLNRHVRFECGIGNRFQCGVCKRRFPHKQNAAIHLKRKHLLEVDSAEEMLASGHIILLSNLPKNSS